MSSHAFLGPVYSFIPIRKYLATSTSENSKRYQDKRKIQYQDHFLSCNIKVHLFTFDPTEMFCLRLGNFSLHYSTLPKCQVFFTSFKHPFSLTRVWRSAPGEREPASVHVTLPPKPSGGSWSPSEHQAFKGTTSHPFYRWDLFFYHPQLMLSFCKHILLQTLNSQTPGFS